jgi:hypothetical protein
MKDSDDNVLASAHESVTYTVQVDLTKTRETQTDTILPKNQYLYAGVVECLL